jgi:hypothetical protein
MGKRGKATECRKIRRVGYTKKQTNKDEEWFDEECAKVNEEKNTVRERAIQIKTRGAKNAYKPARTKESVCSEIRRGSSTKTFQLRLSDIGVFRTLVNFTSA